MQNDTFAINNPKILATGDPRTQFHNFSPTDILKRFGPPRRLLSTSAKVQKSQSVGVLTRILYLTPGVFCPRSTKGCRSSCLGHTSGRMAFRTHTQARDRRAALYLCDRTLFMKRLRAELMLLETDALQHALLPAVRLNGSSDIEWERLDPDLFAEFPSIRFYDYTKLYSRMLDFVECTFPPNYHLTYSLDARNTQNAKDILHRGGNVAAVFWSTLPQYWLKFPVVDGDVHDSRFVDANGVVIGLRAKGLARVDTTGFTIRLCQTCGSMAPPLSLVYVREDTHRQTLHECLQCGFQLDSSWKL